MKEKCLMWWRALATRERKLAVAGGAFIIVFILWYGIWNPLTKGIQNAETQIKRQQSDLVWMQQNSSSVKSRATNNQTRPALKGSIESMVYQSAKNYRLSIKRIQPQGKQISVELDKMGFNPLLDWLLHLEQQYGIYIVSVDISAEASREGVVQVRRLVLRGTDND